MNILIIHYNTPELTKALVKSINLHTPGCNIYIFDNSDKKPFRMSDENITILDNTQKQYFDFDAWLAQYPEKRRTGNNWGSAKHCKSVEICFDLIPDGFILLDSDVLLKRDISELWDETKPFVGAVEQQSCPKNSELRRLMPFVCYINVPMCRKNGIHYCNDKKMWQLVPDAPDRTYDTGAWFLEDCLSHDLQGTEIAWKHYCVHFGHGSWQKAITVSQKLWLNKHQNLFSVPVPSIALCAIGRLENRYAKEFVGHYKSLGFAKLYIYDNNYDGEEHFEDVIGQEISDGFVEIIDWRNRTNCQTAAYEDCYRNHGKDYDWIAFFDFDEFLLVSDTASSIQSILSTAKDFDCLMLSWQVMTDNDLIHYDPRPLMERFTTPMPNDRCCTYDFPENMHVKSIVRGGLSELKWKNPHVPATELRCCNAKGEEMKQSPFMPIDHDAAFIRHFFTKTIDEWLNIKVKRGYPDKNTDGLRKHAIDKFFQRNDSTEEKLQYIKDWTAKQSNDYTIWVTYHKDSLVDEYKLTEDVHHRLFPVHKPAGGVNINSLNPVYSELVTLWYVWKNQIQSKYIGFNHYRRMFNVSRLPKEGECQVLEIKQFKHRTVYLQYARHHNVKDIDLVLDIIAEKYGKGNPYEKYIRTSYTLLPCCCFLMSWENFDTLCQFLFGILDEFAVRTGCKDNVEAWRQKATRDFNGQNVDYQMRLPGFLAERIISAWIINHLKYYTV